jgi:hypothetical protein
MGIIYGGSAEYNFINLNNIALNTHVKLTNHIYAYRFYSTVRTTLNAGGRIYNVTNTRDDTAAITTLLHSSVYVIPYGLPDRIYFLPNCELNLEHGITAVSVEDKYRFDILWYNPSSGSITIAVWNVALVYGI